MVNFVITDGESPTGDWSLSDVCSQLLDNSDLYIQRNNKDLRLTFIVYGKVKKKYWKVVFDLNNVTDDSLNFLESEKEYTMNQWILVLGVDVIGKKINSDNYRWEINIHPELEQTIVCDYFEWELEELSPKEYAIAFNAQLNS